MNEKQLADAIQRAAQTKDKRVNINLAGVMLMSSGMIGALVKGYNLAKSLGVEMRLFNVSRNVIEVFQVTNMNRFFKIEGEDE